MNGLPTDLTSSHSSQRIVQSKLPNTLTADPPPSFLMVIPQQQASQRSSQGNINHQKQKTESTPPVLENAYIQKRLLEQ